MPGGDLVGSGKCADERWVGPAGAACLVSEVDPCCEERIDIRGGDAALITVGVQSIGPERVGGHQQHIGGMGFVLED